MLVDPSLQLIGLRFEAPILLVHAGNLVDVPLTDVLDLLNLLLHFLFIVIQTLLQALIRLRGRPQFLRQSRLRGLTLVHLALKTVHLRPLLGQRELLLLLESVHLLRQLGYDLVFFRNLVPGRAGIVFKLAVFLYAHLERLPLLLEHDIQCLQLLGLFGLFLVGLLQLFGHLIKLLLDLRGTLELLFPLSVGILDPILQSIQPILVCLFRLLVGVRQARVL